MKLTLSRAKELLATTTSDPHLIVHATNVRGCMEAFARNFGQPLDEVEHWGAVGYLHDYDYEHFPEPKSVVKKFKDKKFAAGCNREIIRKGAELVGLDLPAAIAICIDGMKPYAAETGLRQ